MRDYCGYWRMTDITLNDRLWRISGYLPAARVVRDGWPTGWDYANGLPESGSTPDAGANLGEGTSGLILEQLER